MKRRQKWRPRCKFVLVNSSKWISVLIDILDQSTDTIERSIILHINRESKNIQKATWNQLYRGKVKGIAPELLRSKIRGKRAGALVRIRESKHKRHIKTNLPSVFLSNVNRLHNKIDEFEALIAANQLRNCCALVLTVLTSNHSDEQLSLDGYTLLRADRDTNRTNKSQGGGLAIYIHHDWSNSFSIISTHSEPDLETMVVKVRPFWLPRDITCVVFIIVYCPLLALPTVPK